MCYLFTTCSFKGDYIFRPSSLGHQAISLYRGNYTIYFTICEFKVCKSVHHHTVQINRPTRCNNFSCLLLNVYSYVQLNMFRASSRPSSGAKQLLQQPLILPLERVGSSPRPTALLPPRSNGKTRGCYSSCCSS